MSRLDFHLEFKAESPQLRDELLPQAEEHLRALADGHNDLIGAAIAIKELAHEETPHIYQARIVAYIRPKNISAVEKADTHELALKKALEANAQPKRLDLNDIHCKMAKEMGLKIAVSADAHNPADLDSLRFGVDQARRGWLTADDVINTRKLGELKSLLKR